MKLRFLAAAGAVEARATLSTSLARHCGRELVEVRGAKSISLWVEPDTPVVADRLGGAVLVGKLFDGPSGRRLSVLPDDTALARKITESAWGSYVLLTADGPHHCVLRDPSGSVPVYHGHTGPLDVYASDAAMLRLAFPSGFRPDIQAVRHWLEYPSVRPARTGALGISELLPGMAREVTGGQAASRRAWLPEAFAAPQGAFRSFGEAVSALRMTLLETVPRLALGEGPIVLQLSGGLDSSIVAAALAGSAIDFRAITFATRAGEGDERRHARAVAGHLGVELTEITEDEIDCSLREQVDPLHPPASPVLQSLRRALAGASGGKSLLLDGVGGDNVFASTNSASPAIDALVRRGPLEAVRVLGNIAERHGCGFWSAARSSFRRALRRRSSLLPANRTFLTSSSREESSALHPWLASLDDLLPGSTDHLRMIAGIHPALTDPAPNQPCNLHPLIAQPVLEVCLRIPSWMWLQGGRDRAVARAAFRDLIPHAVLDRRGKGNLTSMFVRDFVARRKELRELLVCGRLAAAGIVNPVAVTAFLDRQGEPRDSTYIRILELESAERWIRSVG